MLFQRASAGYLAVGPAGPTAPDMPVSMFAIVDCFPAGASDGGIISTGGPGRYGYCLWRRGSDGKLSWDSYSAGVVRSDLVLVPGVWTAVGACYDPATSQVTFYARRLTASDGVTYGPEGFSTQVQTLSASPSAATWPTECRVGAGFDPAASRAWDGRIAHPCLWHSYRLTLADFDALWQGLHAGIPVPISLGNPGDLQFWFSFEDARVNRRMAANEVVQDASGRGVLGRARRVGSIGIHPVFDLPFDLPRSFALPRQTACRPTPRVWPYPYRAGLTISHDNHSVLDRDRFIRLLRWFNTPLNDPVHGAGLDIEVTASFWPFVARGHWPAWGPQNRFSYYQPLDPHAPVLAVREGDAEVIRQLLRDGLIDALHGYGDFGQAGHDYRPLFQPGYAAAFIGELNSWGIPIPPVWINHGDTNNRHSVGPASFQRGDNAPEHGPSAAEYHWNQTTAAGGGVWTWFASQPSGLASGRLFEDPDLLSPSRAPARAHTWDDRSRGYVFTRYAARILADVSAGDAATITIGGTPTLEVAERYLPGYTYNTADGVLLTSSSTGEVGFAAVGWAAKSAGKWRLGLFNLSDFRLTRPATQVRFILVRCDYAGYGSNFWNMADYFDERLLDNLESRGALAIPYAHLEYYAYDPSSVEYTGYTAERLAASYEAFRRLARRYHEGRIFVAGTARLLRYNMVQNFVTYRVTDRGGGLWRITLDPVIEDPVRGPVTLSLEACRGLTFYKPPGSVLEIYLADEPLPVVQNPPDATGQASASVPWVRLSSPLFGIEVPPGCEDDNPCTVDTWDPDRGCCVHTLVNCDDGNACTADACQPATGACVHVPLPAVDDQNPCTIDLCDPQTGQIVHVPVEVDDGNPCTIDSCDPRSGQIRHVPRNCEDGNLCTWDHCDPQTGECYSVLPPDNQATISGVSLRSPHGTGSPVKMDVPLRQVVAGVFLGSESRTGGVQEVVFSFCRPVLGGVAVVVGGTGVARPGLLPHEISVEVTQHPRESCLYVDLIDVHDGQGAALVGPFRAEIQVLPGDITADGSVNIFDLTHIRNQLGQPLTAANARCDINRDAALNTLDLVLVRNNMGRGISCP